SSGNDAVLWNGKKEVDLGALAPLTGSDSVADGINDSGQVVGTWGTNDLVHAFLYSNGAIANLPVPTFVGSPGGHGRAIHNSRQRQRHRDEPDARVAADAELIVRHQQGSDPPGLTLVHFV